MKSKMNSILVLIAIGLAIIAIARTSSLKAHNAEQKYKSPEKHEEHDDEHLELAVYMGRIQVHFSKLYFAAKADNLPLTKFYTHEINESFETIINANVVDEGHDISALAKQLGEEPFQRFEKNIEENGFIDFDREYNDLILNCNGCHVSTDHSFIKITIPENPPVGNQNFTFTGQQLK